MQYMLENTQPLLAFLLLVDINKFIIVTIILLDACQKFGNTSTYSIFNRSCAFCPYIE